MNFIYNIAKDSDSFARKRTNLHRCFEEQIARCNDASKVTAYFLPKRIALCTHSMHSLFLSKRREREKEREQMAWEEERCRARAVPFYTRNFVTTRFPP